MADPVLELAQRARADELPECTGLAALDATDVGEQRGMLLDVEAGRRRAVIRAVIEHPARPPG
jgi:hypothetical protein